jgi:opacity protein-like surface antigen
VLKDFSLSETSDLSQILGGPSIRSTSKAGFNVAVTGNANSWIGVTFEGGGSFLKQGTEGFENVLVDFEVQQWTALAGPKFTVRQAKGIAPFAEFLAGGAYFSVEIPAADLSDTGWDFVLQPGAGIDVRLSDTVAVRVGVDWRLLSDKAFSGQTFNQFRFTLGVTFRSGLR